ncbi:MAG: glycosyltransferase [Actinobacteria bacterium]|nr:glycosyltransferase [Actinomycetota bacterium]
MEAFRVCELNPLAYHVVTIAPTAFFADYGCHVRILEETYAVRTAGHTTTIFAYPNGSTPPGFDVRRIPAIFGRRNPLVGSHWRKLVLDLLLAAHAIARALPAKFDLVHAHLHEGALIGWAVARLKRVPLVFDYQGSLSSEMLDHQFLRAGNPALTVFELLERLANAAPDRIVTSSINAQAQLMRAGVAARRVVAAPDGVDVERFRPRAPADAAGLTALRRSLGIPADRLIVGYLGLLAEYQGTGDLIRAAAQVLGAFPGAHFLVMGFPNVRAYADAAARAGLQSFMTFTGRVPYADAPEMLRLVDVAVAPKRSETEGHGKLLNYMAVGLPTVAYAGAVAAELLGPDGILAPRGSIDALARELLRLLRDPALRAASGQRLRARAEREFAWSRRIQPILDTYDELTDPLNGQPRCL